NSAKRPHVTNVRKADAMLATLRHVDVVTYHRPRPIKNRFETNEHALQIRLQSGRILLPRLTVDSNRTVFARAFIGAPQPLGIEVMVQRCERHRWIRRRQLGYSLLFR